MLHHLNAESSRKTRLAPFYGKCRMVLCADQLRCRTSPELLVVESRGLSLRALTEFAKCISSSLTSRLRTFRIPGILYSLECMNSSTSMHMHVICSYYASTSTLYILCIFVVADCPSGISSTTYRSPEV